jgi:A/G-specific adenine glycosylase
MQRDLLAWWSERARDLPWRATRDPWAVLVSETMLQQTQVPRVVPRFEAFMEAFPSVRECADASLADVIRAWHGLGYNRRAVSLHRCAQAVVASHDGRIPDDLDGLLRLPGVGPYTARAVLVFAFEHDLGLVDTNAGRFLARAAAGRALMRREAQDVADRLVPVGRGWAWGQAVFDLGALVCTRRAPECDACPISRSCAWAGAQFAGDDPISASAGVSTGQSPFATSDRRGRGRLVSALREGPVAAAELAAVMGWPLDPERAERVAHTVVRDGLAHSDGDRYHLTR